MGGDKGDAEVGRKRRGNSGDSSNSKKGGKIEEVGVVMSGLEKARDREDQDKQSEGKDTFFLSLRK